MRSIRHALLRPLVPGVSLALMFGGLAPCEAASDDIRQGSRTTTVKGVKRRAPSPSLGTSGSDTRDSRRQRPEDARLRGGEEESLDPERLQELQELRAGSNGKSCIYGRKGEVIHQPEGAVCDRPPGPQPPAKAK